MFQHSLRVAKPEMCGGPAAFMGLRESDNASTMVKNNKLEGHNRDVLASD